MGISSWVSEVECVQCGGAQFTDLNFEQGTPEMAESRSLGDAIRLRRLELGMSQEELAERIGPDVRQSDVSRLERGKILFPRLERLNQIASALGMSIGALLIEAGWFTDEETSAVSSVTRWDDHDDIPIVIADDEPISLDAIASLLDDSGYVAATAYDLPSLLETIDATSPGIVLVDIALPGLRPEALIEMMAMRDPAPILVFMGSGLPEVDVEGPYLEKPIDSRQLFAFIASVEKRSSAIPHAANGNGHIPGR
jgi:transcriptional regulator with XRE-family HTH domain